MFFVRFVILAFFAAYSVSMSREPALNSLGVAIAFSALFFVPALYLLPTFEAWIRKKSNLQSIAVLNLFLGWTIIGWVAALIWAFKKPEEAVVVAPAMAEPVTAADTPEKKTCPFCAEQVMAAAIKCKHCGSELPAT
ncbi:superinfection immunity protein [Pseudomonas sp. BEA3.1]|uniref:superinfection immunity protein n=1 Tax=Pseudomonas sp. BEA3.1 TaxID=3083251 RepID=UPI002963E9C0|nr:superinfection immunity protein [Pseudomonas sp. BEA3.1]MDW2775261.1 superinfection immunity protein [Pseudomonas sp. BEA3.1]